MASTACLVPEYTCGRETPSVQTSQPKRAAVSETLVPFTCGLCGDFSHPEVDRDAGCGSQASEARDLHDARTWVWIELQLGCMGMQPGDRAAAWNARDVLAR
mgnify:CR=1 FL=1